MMSYEQQASSVQEAKVNNEVSPLAFMVTDSCLHDSCRLWNSVSACS